MRTHTQHLHTVTLPNGIDVEVDLPIKADEGYGDEPITVVKNDKILVSYLAPDLDPQNPLEDCDGMGHIYSSHRHSETHSEMQEALGLDSDWSPDLGLVEDKLIVEAALKEILADPEKLAIAVEHCDEHWPRYDGEEDVAFITRVLDYADEFYGLVRDLDDIRLELWKSEREAGDIGNPHAVSLDVYEHGLTRYSLSGGGPQCRFDTASGGAVWVPDAICVDEIKRRGPVYRKGKITCLEVRGPKRYGVRTWEKFGVVDQVVHPTFETWGEAFKYLEEWPEEACQFIQEVSDGEDDAARELAKQAADQYTDYVNGNCFVIVHAEYEVPEGLEDEGVVLQAYNYDCCCGYIGSDYALETLKEEFDSRQQSL